MSYDQGRIYSTHALPPDENADTTLSETQHQFRQFIYTFDYDRSFIYRDQLRENILVKDYFLSVQLAHVHAFNNELAQSLVDTPSLMLPLFEKAARECAQRIVYGRQQQQNETGAAASTAMDTDLDGQATEDELASTSLPEIQIVLKSDSNPMGIRDLDAKYISKLVRVPGIVIGASTPSSKATSLQLMCRSCRHLYKLDVGGGFAGLQIPRKCLAEPVPGEDRDCPMDPYIIVHDRSKYIDQQILKLQEAPDMIPVGDIPRHILLSVDRSLTNKIVPGTRCIATGIYSTFQGQVKDGSAVRNPYIRVVGMDMDIGRGTQTTFTDAEEEEFMAMARDPEFYERFSRSIAPSIFGHTDIKKAIACLLVGGSKKILADGLRIRGDINVLLLGDPGTAKSQLLKFVEKVSPIAIYTSGKGSSAAGLTATVQRESSTREFYLEGGAMVLADGGVVCIDEFDKMREEDRVAIHEAMEQQTISIAKAGITTILNSRTSVLAAANPVFGRYDDLKNAGDNVDFQTTILSRFDSIFIIKDEHNEQRDKIVAQHVIETHQNVQTHMPEVDGEIPIEKMKRFISFCKSRCAPRLTPDAAEQLASNFVGLRKAVHQAEQQANERSSIPMTVRQLEAVIRITEALAKMRLSPIATTEHVQEAIRLFNASTMHAAQQDGPIRQDLVREVRTVEEEIKKRLPIGWSTSFQTLLREFVHRRQYNEMAFYRALSILEQRGSVQFRHQRTNVIRVAV